MNLEEALDKIAWWKETCAYWRGTCQIAQRQRDLANARVDSLAKFERVLDLAVKRRCGASVGVSYDDIGVERYEGSVYGERGWNNHWVCQSEDTLLDDMIQWLEREPDELS